MRRVRSPTPRSGLAGSTSSESMSRSPSFMSPSGSARNSTCQSDAALRISGSERRRRRSTVRRSDDRRFSASKLLAQRPHRLLLQDGDDALQPGVLVGVEVDGVAARREGRVLQRLEVLPHVLDDRVDNVAGRPSGRRAVGRRRPFGAQAWLTWQVAETSTYT